MSTQQKIHPTLKEDKNLQGTPYPCLLFPGSLPEMVGDSKQFWKRNHEG